MTPVAGRAAANVPGDMATPAGLGRSAGVLEARPYRVAEDVPEGRVEEVAPAVPVWERLSAETDARWAKTGQRGFFGDKGPVCTDEGQLRGAAARTPDGEAPHIPEVVDGRTGCRVPPSRI